MIEDDRFGYAPLPQTLNLASGRETRGRTAQFTKGGVEQFCCCVAPRLFAEVVDGLSGGVTIFAQKALEIIKKRLTLCVGFSPGFRDPFGSLLTINGGTLVVNAYGDGLDSNGSIAMTGGTVLVSGPTEQMNGAIDYNGGFVISGGLLVAAGSSGMAEAPATDSTQSSVLIYFSATQPGGTTVNIQDSTGQNVLTFTPAKNFQSIVVSSSALTSGASYTVYTGGAATGTIVDGLVTDGSYSGGTQAATFSVSSSVTQVGSGGGFGPGGCGLRIGQLRRDFGELALPCHRAMHRLVGRKPGDAVGADQMTVLRHDALARCELRPLRQRFAEIGGDAYAVQPVRNGDSNGSIVGAYM